MDENPQFLRIFPHPILPIFPKKNVLPIVALLKTCSLPLH